MENAIPQVTINFPNLLWMEPALVNGWNFSHWMMQVPKTAQLCDTKAALLGLIEIGMRGTLVSARSLFCVSIFCIQSAHIIIDGA